MHAPARGEGVGGAQVFDRLLELVEHFLDALPGHPEDARNPRLGGPAGGDLVPHQLPQRPPRFGGVLVCPPDAFCGFEEPGCGVGHPSRFERQRKRPTHRT